MTTVHNSQVYFEGLQKQITSRVDGLEGQLLADFARLFWSRALDEDIEHRDLEDDAGLFIDSGRLFQSRQTNDITIDVMNPVRARDGWQSRHTIVRIMAPDMPFATDSVLMTLADGKMVMHLLHNVVFAVDRDDKGLTTRLSMERDHQYREFFVYAEIDRLSADDLPNLKSRLQATMDDVQAAVHDFLPMKAKLEDIMASVRNSSLPLADSELSEGLKFLEWLSRDHFTFLGYREFRYTDDKVWQAEGSLGVLRNRAPASTRTISTQEESAREFLLEPCLLSYSKGGTRSKVHRPAYPDYVGIKQFNEAGEVVGEWGFLGLYTSNVYMQHPREIPVVRQKIQEVMARSEFDPGGFDGKVLAQILATYPRDELFQISLGELLQTSVLVTKFHERRKLKLFVREDRYGLFVTCLLYMPRDLYNTRSRTLAEKILVDAFDAIDADYDVLLSESLLVRAQFNLRLRPGSSRQVDQEEIEQRITQTISDWTADLGQSLVETYGETRGRKLIAEYHGAFSAGYREHQSAKVAADDVGSCESLSPDRDLITRLYRHPEDDRHIIRLKVFHLGDLLPLSDQIPKIENLGLRVLAEESSKIRRSTGAPISIHDFQLTYETELDLDRSSNLFEEAYIAIWQGIAEDDGFNRLILGAGLSWRQVSVLRAYARYLKQIRLGFSQDFISGTLYKHRHLAAVILRIFEQRFALEQSPAADNLEAEFTAGLDGVEVLNEDRILRRLFDAIQATTRTNYYQSGQQQQSKPYLSFKLEPANIPGIPRPAPRFEIFVCAPYFEGVHLRGGPIARGGLRWSDRLEDYRTEVLGLMKAQIVKNGVIVPTGAKGGFVLKGLAGGQLPDVLDCYREFISGLLDITDNIVDGVVQAPAGVRRLDEEDPYLVVAADKGTATFSDYANEVAESRGFWLGDAFASGGSNGYDHKTMGITARGAWVSVQRHFAERDIDVQTEPVTVLGIGDMSGDVFGNGLLLSKSIKLVAAFNHQHIFLDPDPDSALGYAERARLFNLPRSSWQDYDESIISVGGGVYSRSLKSITLSRQVMSCFDIKTGVLSPDELLHELLKAPVQLLWNGGIGTYVKSAAESHDDAGDKANDQIRVNAVDLRVDVIGEGGNLGITQLARIEFGEGGGSVNTDFIDNSAGVDCSDHEVNLKILLNQIVVDGDITTKQRNQQLASMTDSVAELVLANNRNQARSLSLAIRHQQNRLADYGRFITYMEAEAGLDRMLEFLPSDEKIAERESRSEGFTRPELSVLLSYSKIHLKNTLRDANLHKDPGVAREALRAFPDSLSDDLRQAVLSHQLAPEIVASQVANTIVDYMGITFVVHNMEFVGARVGLIARAYLAFSRSFGLRDWFDEVESVSTISESLKLELLLEIMGLGRAGTRWILRHRRELGDLDDFVAHHLPQVSELLDHRSEYMSEMQSRDWRETVDHLIAAGLPEVLAERTAKATRLAEIFPMIDTAEKAGVNVQKAALIFARLSQSLRMDWFGNQLAGLPTHSHWEAMERNAMLDDNNTQLSMLAEEVLMSFDGDYQGWLGANPDFVADWDLVMNEAERLAGHDLSMYSLTTRKLSDLRRAVQKK